MARPIRIQFPGAVYHIMARGNGGQKIFKDKLDYGNFLMVFSDVLYKYNIISYGYCLMPNHYHLLVETPDPNLSMAMRQLNGVYTQKYNFRHKRYGHLLQGRFKSILVDMDTYRYEIIRYIALNPSRAKLVKNPKEWTWSSHNELLGKLKAPSGCLDADKVLKLFHNDKNKARKIYLKNIDLKIENDILLKEIEKKPIIGSAEFIEKVKNFFEKQSKEKEIPKQARFAHRPDLQKLFQNIKDKNDRNNRIKKAYSDYGYTLSEIGREAGLHYVSISRIVNGADKVKC